MPAARLAPRTAHSNRTAAASCSRSIISRSDAASAGEQAGETLRDRLFGDGREVQPIMQFAEVEGSRSAKLGFVSARTFDPPLQFPVQCGGRDFRVGGPFARA